VNPKDMLSCLKNKILNQTLSMDQAFLNRLSEIVDANLENEKFGPPDIYHALGMSRSSIHRKLISLNQESLCHFIQEKRLHKAMELLRHNVATASEIAFMTGFSSPEYFNRCFHDYYGYPPGQVKKIASNGQETIANRNIHIPETNHPDTYMERTEGKVQKKMFLKVTINYFLIILAVITLIFLINILFINQSIFPIKLQSKEPEKSIAVLPFKNLNYNSDNQYFTDGVMVDILNYLSQISGLRVISRTTTEHFRGSVLPANEIAKKMNVNYLLEGTVQKYQGKVRVNVNLIDIQRDRNKWTQEYDMELSDIFSVQSDIAKQIAGELRTALSIKETEQIERIPTRNLEAYNLYQKGRYFRDKRTEEGFKKSVDYFEKSIEEDPQFALAYSGLADVYFHFPFNGWYPKSERYDIARELVSHALKLDSNLSEAHAILGNLLSYSEYKWEEARKEFLMAVEYNPNDATARQYYAEFLEITGQTDEARRQIDLALELDPLSLYILKTSADFYYFEGRFEESLDELRKMEEIDPDLVQMIWTYVEVYLSMGEHDKALDVIRRFYMASPLLSKNVNTLKKTYNESGINGVLQFMLNLELKHFRRPMALAENYAWLNYRI